MNKRHRIGLILAIAILFFSCVCVQGSYAASGKELSGTYRMTSTTNAGEDVLVTLQVQLYNHTDADVSVQSAKLNVVHLESHSAQDAPAPIAGPFDLKAYETCEFTQQVMISGRAYESWKRGQHPGLYVTYQTADGETVHRTIPLTMSLPKGGE